MKRPSATFIIVALCVLFLLIVWRSFLAYDRTLVITVEALVSQSSVLGLQRIIAAQKKTIDLYSQRPKIVYRCLDDMPKIKYPKHASDRFTTVTMGTNDECGDTSDLDAVIIVHTAAYHFERRENFRKIYSNRKATWPYKLKVVFLVGRALDAELQINLEIENRKYGDTVQGNFLDTYQNLTLKAVMGYRWLKETCAPRFKLLIKMDDDVVFDVHAFFGEYFSPLPNHRKKKRIFCQVWRHAQVNRHGKWKVERGLFANKSYDFPYCSGFFVGITPDLIRPMYEVAKSIEFFWIDDVFMYGMVPSAIRYVGFSNIGGWRGGLLTQNWKKYQTCITELKDKCKYLAIVTSTSDEFFQTYGNFSHQISKLNSTSPILLTAGNENIEKASGNLTDIKKPAVKKPVNSKVKTQTVSENSSS